MRQEEVLEPQADGQCMREMTIDEKMDDMRKQLKNLGAYLDSTKQTRAESTVDEGENRGEVMANLTLAYRHIEDAAMRLGKVKQHLNDGVSVYDKNVVGSPK